jgi:hypothetical protein
MAAALKPRFKFKHVDLHPGHRYWRDLGHYYISAAKNTGILYADGELCVTCDDAEFFPSHFLSGYWRYWLVEKKLAHAYHKRWKTIHTVNGLPVYPLQGDGYINETRNFPEPVRRHSMGNWLWAGTSFPLELAVRLNGFNERMDSYKSLEDCEFGERLVMSGMNFVLDKNLWLDIIDHPSYADRAGSPEWDLPKLTEFIALENYGIWQWSKELGERIANKHPITDAQLQLIKRETLKYRNFDPLAPENADKLRIWAATPTFDLAAERQALRASSEWK